MCFTIVNTSAIISMLTKKGVNMESENKIKVFIADAEDGEKLGDYFAKSNNFQLLGVAKSGPEALDKIVQNRPNVVIMEVMLPEMDGFMVIDNLKKQLGQDMPKIIFTSHLSHSGFIAKAMKEGVSYFMVKPVNPENLQARINDILTQNQKADRVTDRGLDEKISNIFISIGIPANIKGYQFLREAVKLAVAEPEIIGSITKKLYPTIAERFSTSSSKVERGMRHAIEVAWNRGKIENINSLFGLKIYNNNEKPTNGELIALIADKMLMEG